MKKMIVCGREFDKKVTGKLRILKKGEKRQKNNADHLLETLFTFSNIAYF